MPWYQQQLAINDSAPQLLHGGIGKRNFYRLHAPDRSYVLMDSSGDPIMQRYYQAYIPMLQTAGVVVPDIIAENNAEHQCILTDFGDRHLLAELASGNHVHFDQQILEDWWRWQTLSSSLPRFDWLAYGGKLALIVEQTTVHQDAYIAALEDLLEEVRFQPQGVCHGDLHSLNIMITDDQRCAYLDFQGLSNGPITYDWVSLLRDCYVSRDQAAIERGFDYCYQRYAALQDQPIAYEALWRFFELTGLMRHLRCYALFKQQQKLNNKLHYAEYLQRVKAYIQNVSQRYADYALLSELV